MHRWACSSQTITRAGVSGSAPGISSPMLTCSPRPVLLSVPTPKSSLVMSHTIALSLMILPKLVSSLVLPIRGHTPKTQLAPASSGAPTTPSGRIAPDSVSPIAPSGGRLPITRPLTASLPVPKIHLLIIAPCAVSRSVPLDRSLTIPPGGA